MTTNRKWLFVTTAVLQQRSFRQKCAIALLTMQLVMACITWLAAWYLLESILATGPLLMVIGFVFAMVVGPLDLWIPLLVGLSAPVVCAVGAFTIAAFRLNPKEAQLPILIILAIYLCVFLPAAAVAVVQILPWPNQQSSRPEPTWRYSMKSLLGAMTAVAVLTVLATAAFQSRPDFPIVFGAYGFATTALACFVVWRFFVQRRRKNAEKTNRIQMV